MARHLTALMRMRALSLLLTISISSASAATSGSSAVLTDVRAIHSLSLKHSGETHPVAIEGTVTFYSSRGKHLFVQDRGAGVYVNTNANAPNLLPGDRVKIKGATALGFRPKVIASDIVVISHGKLPHPARAQFDHLIRGEFDSILVSVHGIVHSADPSAPSHGGTQGAALKVVVEGGDAVVYVANANPGELDRLLDAEVEIIGVAGGEFDGKRQMTGLTLNVSSMAQIKILKPAPANPWSLPLTPMNAILTTYRVSNLSSRTRVAGTVTYFEPGSTLVLQSGDQSLWIKTRSLAPMRVGDQAEAIGFPGVSRGLLTLDGSEIRDLGKPSPVNPLAVTWDQLASNRHIFDLVSIEGSVAMQVNEPSQDEYVLLSGGQMFSAIYHHGNNGNAPIKPVPIGSEIRVTGICSTDNDNPFGREVPFNILLRNADDLQVVSKPSMVNAENLSIITSLLLLVILAYGARAWLIDRAMRAQLAELGYLTQRRGEVLEAINKSRPIAETLELITELASFTLKGAPCWCQVNDGPKLGNCPKELNASSLRIAERPIASHSGPALGSIFAAFDARTSLQPDEKKALANASELATLAIETARLHSDLVHRSEFDILTDIQNRFSFDKHLDRLIDESGQRRESFGLIYIDLDKFKLVNDHHGHQVGDVYLQHVAERMKHQLRPGDLIARLGGDEFGALIPSINDRSDVAEIVARLERCFEEPFAVQGRVLRGMASIGYAIYPEDATTKDNLLSTADAAMYLEKHTREQINLMEIDGVAEKPSQNPPAEGSSIKQFGTHATAKT
jgi:diguanylate cyclase (GGDEF)-like protein